MPQNDGEVRVEITGDNSKLKKELKETESAVKDTTDSVSEMTAALEDTSGASDNFTDIAESAEEAAKAISGVSEEAKKLGEEASKPVALPDIGESLEKRVSQILSSSAREINNLEKQLSEIDKSLQLNPNNVELLGQKFAVLGGQISATRDKLDQLKAVEQEVTQKFANGEISATQYNAFRREILNTEAALRDLVAEQDNMLDESGKLRNVTNEMDNLGDSIKNAGEKTITFGDLLKANLLSDYIQKGIGKLAEGFWGFLKKGVDLASNLQEVQNVVDTTFGDGAEQIYSWSEAAAESFGMSSLQAQNFNGTLGAMLKSMGLTDDAVLKMSTDMVGLAGDMASFYNLDVETAFEKIRAGISGETEPLKQLGINMSVANLEAYALAQGIETAYDKMSQSEQAILRYNYLMSVTADAQGDFAKTSDSFANQQRILQLQWENLSASLGQKLLPSLNNVLITTNEKLPQAERSIENIGRILGTVTEFALDNHEAILSLIAAYGTFYGVMKAGNAVSTAVTAIKSLTTATKSAEAAQHGMNAAAAANPYVLLASAIAAVTVGFIAFANSADTVHNELKDINKDIENLKKNTDESIAATESEIAVFRSKAAQYEELREKANRTAGEEERLAGLAQELQQYMPEGTRLIDEQTGAYNSLADSIDGVASAMRRKAAISAYEDEYTGLIKQQLEAEKALEDAMKKEAELSALKEGGPWYLKTAADIAYGIAKDDLSEAQMLVDDLEGQISDLDKKIAEFYDNQESVQETAGIKDFYDYDSALSATGRYYETQGKLAVEATEKEKAAREQDLKNFVTDLDKKQDLRRLSEQEYYDELYDYLMKHEDRESKEWFKQLGRYEEYQQKQTDAAVKAAEKAKSDQDKLAKEQQEAEKNRINDSVTALKDRLEADKNYTEEMYYNDLEALIGTLDKESELYKKFNSEILKGRRKLADDDEKKLLDEQNKIVEDGLSEILKTYEKAFDDLEKKRESYRKKLMSVGGDLFSVDTVKDKNGKEKTVYTVNNLNEQLKKMREFHSQVSKLKERGASESLLSELFALDDKDAAQFSKYLSGMSSAEFAQINELYNEKQKLADELANDLYASEAKKLSESILTELDGLSVPSADYGKAAADSYIDAFKTEFEERSDEFAKLFENTDMAAEIKATVETEISRYSAAAFTAPVVKSGADTPSGESRKNSDIEEILKSINKPIYVEIDGGVIAKAVIKYQDKLKRRTGG